MHIEISNFVTFMITFFLHWYNEYKNLTAVWLFLTRLRYIYSLLPICLSTNYILHYCIHVSLISTFEMCVSRLTVQSTKPNYDMILCFIFISFFFGIHSIVKNHIFYVYNINKMYNYMLDQLQYLSCICVLCINGSCCVCILYTCVHKIRREWQIFDIPFGKNIILYYNNKLLLWELSISLAKYTNFLSKCRTEE